MKFLKALTQKKLAKAVVCGLVLSGGVFVGMGQAFAFLDPGPIVVDPGELPLYFFGKKDKSEWFQSYVSANDNIGTTGFIGEWSGTDCERIYGGAGFADELVSSNIITISGGNVGAFHGGYSENSKNNGPSYNTVTIKGDAVIYSGLENSGGFVFNGSGNAYKNTVNLLGGTLKGTIYGGRAVSGQASENTVNIAVSLGDKSNNVTVYGGAAGSGDALNNTVNLIGNGGKLDVVTGYKNNEPITETLENKNGDITIHGQLFGGQAYNTSTGNTLNVAGKNTSVGNIGLFQNLNFYIQDSLTYGDTMVNITGGGVTTIEGAKLGVIIEGKPQDKGADKTINLLKKSEGTITWTAEPKEGENYTIVVKEGAKITIDNTKNGVALSEDGKALVLTLGGIEETKDETKAGSKTTLDLATPAAMPLFEAIENNKENLSESIKAFSTSLLGRLSSVDFSDKASVEAAVSNIKAAVSGAYQATEITGTTSTAVSVVNNVSNLTFSRMSLVDSASVNGGKGVGLMAPDSGADVWARYVHGKDKADGINMDGGSADYSNNYNGFIVGADFKKVGKFQSGIAFSYVDGSGNNTFKDTMGAAARYGHTDFHTYNFGYYGSVKNDDTNTMFDISYGTTSSDSDTNGVGGAQSFSSKSKIFNAGVTAEKSFAVSGMKLVPYTGLRYMHVDGGEYTDSLGIHHRADKQNVFMLPVGLKLSKENKLSHDWTVTPKLDLSYTWNMGDTDSEMTVSVPGLTPSRLGYSVMDSGSFMGVAGVEAQHKNWTYGVSYSYQKGGHQDSKKIIADIKMSF